MNHLNLHSLDTFAEQLVETPTTLSEAGINDEYCWDSEHPMGWDCAICRAAESNHLSSWLYIGARLIDMAFCAAYEQDAQDAIARLQRPATSRRTQALWNTACSAWVAWLAVCEEEEVRM